MAEVQVYNSRSKKYVLLDDAVKGGIKDMQPKPFKGVDFKHGRPNEVDPQPVESRPKEFREAEEMQPQPVEENDGGGGFFSFFKS